MNGNRFFKKKGTTGFLLVHGLTSSTQEMEELSSYLYSRNYTVLVTLLKGHNTYVKKLRETTWHDWYDSVERDFDFLSKRCNKIYVVGLSMGATLSMHLVANKKISKIKRLILLSPAIFYVSVLARLTPYLRYIKKYGTKNYSNYYPGRKESFFDIADEKELNKRIAYKKVPLKSVASALDLIRIVKKEMKDIRVPTLIIHSVNDHTIKPESSKYIYDRLNVSQEEKRLVYLKNSGHVITIDFDKKIVFKEILDFIKG